MSPFDLSIWARTVWGEARGEGKEGMRAVAHAINNRHKAGKWFSGQTMAETCLYPAQFSCWDTRDPNRRRMARVNDEDVQFKEACLIVQTIRDGTDPDPTNGATHYYSTQMVLPPEWTKAGQMTAQIGEHKFYSGVA